MSDYFSCDYWGSLYVHIAKKYAGNIRITLEIMEKNLGSFRDNTGGECRADPRDSNRARKKYRIYGTVAKSMLSAKVISLVPSE